MAALGILLLCVVVGWRRPGFLIAPLFYGYTADALGAPGGASTAIVTVLAILMLAAPQWRSLASTRLGPIDWSVIAFLAWHCLSATWMLNNQYALSQVPALLTATVSVYLAARLLGQLPDQADRMMEVAWGFALLGTGMAFLVATQGDVVGGRLSLGDASAVGLAQPMPLATLAALFLVLRAPGVPRKFIAVTCFLMLLFTTTLTGTRGSLIGIAAGVVILFLYASRRTQLVALYLALMSALVGGLYVTVAGLDIDLPTTSRLFDWASYGSSTDASSLERLFQYAEAWDLIRQSPLFGSGLGSFAYVTGYPYPHSFVLEVWSQSGVVGLVLFACAAGSFMLGQARVYRTIPEVAIIVVIVAAGFAQQQVSFSIPIGKAIFLVGLVAACATALPSERNRSPSPDGPRSGWPVALQPPLRPDPQ